jgi:hypothetical protein
MKPNGSDSRPSSPLFSIGETAAYLKKKDQWCARILRRFIPIVKVGGTPMYRKEDIDRYIMSQLQHPVDIRDVKSTVSLKELIRGNRI